MLFKLIATLALTLTLAGCMHGLQLKYAANQVCGASSERKEELADSFDKANLSA